MPAKGNGVDKVVKLRNVIASLAAAYAFIESSFSVQKISRRIMEGGTLADDLFVGAFVAR